MKRAQPSVAPERSAMTSRTKRLLSVALGMGLALGVGVSYFLHLEFSPQEGEVRSSKRAEAIGVACEWARTAPLPESARVVSVSTAGSMFTREFRVTFFASADAIADWLERSPGPREAIMTTLSPGIRHFQILPGGGAAFAEITVDETQQRVVIHAYWS